MAAPEVLVIEDDPDTSRLFLEVLGDAGFRAAGCRPDALPERNGYSAILTDLCVHTRSAALAREWVTLLRDRYTAPVIVVSGQVAVTDRDLTPLAADVMRKPIDIDELVRRVGIVLSKSRGARS